MKEQNLEMVRNRLIKYEFEHRFEAGCGFWVPPCKHCFMLWLLSKGKDDPKLVNDKRGFPSRDNIRRLETEKDMAKWNAAQLLQWCATQGLSEKTIGAIRHEQMSGAAFLACASSPETLQLAFHVLPEAAAKLYVKIQKHNADAANSMMMEEQDLETKPSILIMPDLDNIEEEKDR